MHRETSQIFRGNEHGAVRILQKAIFGETELLMKLFSLRKKEIEIINPDVVVWLGVRTYDMDLHINFLSAKQIGDKIYFLIDDKQIPILRMWHTAYYQGKIEPLQGYTDRRIGKLCAKCREEMKRYNLI